MSILFELEKRGIQVILGINKYTGKPDFYRGYKTTPCGAMSAMEDECDDGKRIYFLNLDFEDGTSPISLSADDKMVYITRGTPYAGKIKSIEEGDALAAEGKILAFRCCDLYSEYYNFPSDPDLEAIFTNGCSARSKKYLEQVERNIGLTSWTDAEDSNSGDGKWETLEHPKTFSLALNADTEVGQVDDRHWIAQTMIQAGIDTFMVVKMHFDHRPSATQIGTAFDIRDCYYDLMLRRQKEVFTCWECGHMTHWLDIPGNLHQKMDYAKDSFCGHCDYVK